MRAIAVVFYCSLTCLFGCVTASPPMEEYTLARSAIEAARAVEAARHSSGYFHQAEEAYRKAQGMFEDREYDRARLFFVKARIAAEKAENSARLIRLKSGEVF